MITGLLPTSIAAYVQLNYPLNQQFPPVALINTQYSFQFAPTTFRTDSDKIQYSLAGGPSWLSLDSKSRTLSGTPHASDVGEITFTIAASGTAGAVANMDAKLLVVKDNEPKASRNVTQVLSRAGQLSGPRVLSLGPSKSFDIMFPMDTFDSAGKSVTYNAILSVYTPLPARISFDATSLHFAGTTPPASSAQIFEILLVACADPGYASFSLSFTLAVSNHQLLFQPFSETVNVSKGADINIDDIKSKLLLDGSPIQGKDVQSVNATMPSWLKLDNSTFIITGKAPPEAMSQDINVSAEDQYGDVAQFSIHLAITSELFAHEMGQLNATAGANFDYALSKDFFVKDGEKVTMKLGTLSDHLRFDPNTSTISGAVPAGFPPGFVQCSMVATSKDGSLEDSQSFQITVSGDTSNGTTETTTGGSSSVGNATGGKKAGMILGTVIGAICCIVLLIALMLCLRRRKKNRSYISPKLPRSPRKSDISRPMFIPYGWPDVDIVDDHDQDLEKGKEKEELAPPPTRRTADNPPNLDVDLPVDHRDTHSLTDSIGDADTRILDTFEESSFGIMNDIAPSQHPHDSMKIPTELAKRASQNSSNSYRKHKRRTTTVYQDQIHRSSGLPVNRRITGMGHGRHTYSLSRSNTNFSRSSIPRPLSTSSYTTTRCTSTFSAPPSPFPQSTMGRQRTAQVTTPTEERRSIRVVPASRRSSIADRRPLDEKRNSYIRKRASAQSPFFSAAGSRRISSSTYKSPPAFIDAKQSPRSARSPRNRNTIIRPDDDAIEGKQKEVPESVPVRKPSVSPSSDTPTRTSIGPSSRGMGRRASTRESLKAYNLKSKLNDLTGSEIFKDAELSDSVYTDEEDDIEEAEKHMTVKPGQFTLPPLNIDTRRRSKRDSGERQKRTSKRDSRRELKRTSERDPTPYYHLASQAEHGGKENQSSTYTLGTRSSPIRIDFADKLKHRSSPERPKPSAHPPRSDARKTHQPSTTDPCKPESTKEHHSRKSLHSRSESRQSVPRKKRAHSRSQSTAYPYFDIASIDTTRPSSIGNAIATAADAVCDLPESHTKPSITRDLSGNITFYDLDEEPEIEELGSSSIGFTTENGRISETAKRSHPAALHESSRSQDSTRISIRPPPKSAKRETAVPFPLSSPTAVRPAGLGLFPVDARAELCAAGRDGHGDRERTPLSTLTRENRTTVEVEDGKLEVAKARQTWGSWKSVLSRGGRLVSGGHWEKQGKEDKVFI
ncbi:hypothetical protein EK21DRAFT_106954 [Setomelanomma holmii]|uniref:Dystroglycan-type cadherin-like domain-containing protein n=1 Tax=Setomelanomma holmii TaxID=210430 RepID=A0A9P4HKX6_9PLEO|nr:hypothetical protein EK21DRAFT_106954 [Setomelanomma holmii]